MDQIGVTCPNCYDSTVYKCESEDCGLETVHIVECEECRMTIQFEIAFEPIADNEKIIDSV